MTPRFSVVLPVRNGAAYVELALRSLLAQSLQDFEVVVLENASTDGTGRIVAEAAASDARVRVIPAERSLSMAENWGRIPALCRSSGIRGDFLTLTGHDDRFEPDYLAVMARLIATHPDARLYQTHFRIIDAQGAVTQLARPMPERESQRDFFLARCWELRDTFGTGYLFRRDDYVAVGGIAPYPRLMFGDDMLWLRLMGKGIKATAPEVCFEYRRHESNTSSEQTPERYLATLQALRRFLDDVELEFPALLDGEMNRDALRHLVLPILKHAEKGAYRTGFDLALAQPDYDALAARLARHGGAVPPLRGRPVKRALHALKRLAFAATRPRR